MPHAVSAAKSWRSPSRSSRPLSARPRRKTLPSPRAKARMWSAETIAEATPSAQPVLLLRVRGEGDTVARPVRDAEGAALALRHSLEEIGRNPIDPLHEESIGQGGRHVQGQLVDDVGRHPDLVGGGELTDAQSLREAVGPAHVWHEMARATSAQAARSSASAGSSYHTSPRSSRSSAWRMDAGTSSFWFTSTIICTPSPRAWRTASTRWRFTRGSGEWTFIL